MSDWDPPNLSPHPSSTGLLAKGTQALIPHPSKGTQNQRMWNVSVFLHHLAWGAVWKGKKHNLLAAWEGANGGGPLWPLRTKGWE